MERLMIILQSQRYSLLQKRTCNYSTPFHNESLNLHVLSFQNTPGGVPHNIIHVLRRERGYSIQQAIDHSYELLKHCTKRWNFALSQVPCWDCDTDREVHRYLEGILDQVRGNLDWRYVIT